MKSFFQSSIAAWRRRIVKQIFGGAAFAFAFVTTVFAGAEKISLDLARALENGIDSVPVIVMMKGIPLIPHTMAIQLKANDVEQMIKQRAMQLQTGMREYVKDLAGAPGVMSDSA